LLALLLGVLLALAVLGVLFGRRERFLGVVLGVGSLRLRAVVPKPAAQRLGVGALRRRVAVGHPAILVDPLGLRRGGCRECKTCHENENSAHGERHYRLSAGGSKQVV